MGCLNSKGAPKGAAPPAETPNPVVSDRSDAAVDRAEYNRSAKLVFAREHPLLAQAAQVPVRLSGMLTKRGTVVRSWKQRFFLLGSGFIKYFEREVPAEVASLSKDAAGLKGELELAGGAVQRHPPAGEHRYVLQVLSGQGPQASLVLAFADDEELCSTWLRAIQHEIQWANEQALADSSTPAAVRQWYEAREARAREAIRFLSEGARFEKHFLRLGGFAKKHPRFVALSADGGTLTWKAAGKDEGEEYQSMAFHEVRAVHDGSSSPVLRAAKAPADRCLTVWTPSRSLDLEAPSQAVRDQWVASLRDAMYFCHLEQHRASARAPQANAATRKRLSVMIKQQKG